MYTSVNFYPPRASGTYTDVQNSPDLVLYYKARKQMNHPLGQIFETSKAAMETRASKNERLSSYIPGHPEAASNVLANIWNTLDLKSASSVTAAKILAKNYFKSV